MICINVCVCVSHFYFNCTVYYTIDQSLVYHHTWAFLLTAKIDSWRTGFQKFQRREADGARFLSRVTLYNTHMYVSVCVRCNMIHAEIVAAVQLD